MFVLISAVCIGITAGISSGVFGIGGGIVIIPMLLFILKLSQIESVATSLIALLLPVGSLGVYQYYKSGYVSAQNVKVGLLISIGMVIGTFFGAKLAVHLDSKYLSKAFAVFLFLISVKIWRG